MYIELGANLSGLLAVISAMLWILILILILKKAIN